MSEVRHGRGRNGRPTKTYVHARRSIFETCGLVNELLFEMEQNAADMDDDEVSAAVFLVRQRLIGLGNLLAQRRKSKEAA